MMKGPFKLMNMTIFITFCKCGFKNTIVFTEPYLKSVLLIMLLHERFSFHLLLKLKPCLLNIAGEKFCPNDIAVNYKTGDVYVTNSLGNFLWKVTKDGTPSVFVKNENFSQPIIVDNFQHVGLNGIVYEPRKYLLAVQTNSGALFRIGLEDRSVHKVIMKESLPMADGMALREDGETLVVVSAEKVWLVGSASNWMAANVVDTVPLNVSDVTTATAMKKGSTFILHSYLLDMLANQSREDFEIREIKFPAEDALDSDPVWLIVLIVVVVVVVSLWRFQMGHFYEQYRLKKA